MERVGGTFVHCRRLGCLDKLEVYVKHVMHVERQGALKQIHQDWNNSKLPGKRQTFWLKVLNNLNFIRGTHKKNGCGRILWQTTSLGLGGWGIIEAVSPLSFSKIKVDALETS